MRFLFLISLLTLASACHPHADAAVSSAQQEPARFSLPSIPTTLRTPADRAAYLVEHYWDHTPLSDPRVTSDSTRLEQFWVDYLSILPHVGDSTLVASCLTQVTQAVASSPDSTALPAFVNLARHYLFDPDSPVYQTEDLFLPVLDAAISAVGSDGNPLLELEVLERCKLDRRMAQQNREGTIATNFVYKLPNGRTSTLHTTPVGNGTADVAEPFLLLLFYDPDCDHCMETISQYSASFEIAQAVADGKLSILAIDTEGSATRWQQTLDVFPESWRVGFDRDMNILVNDLYSLRSMPTLLLLDNRYRVVRKNPNLQWLTKKL